MTNGMRQNILSIMVILLIAGVQAVADCNGSCSCNGLEASCTATCSGEQVCQCSSQNCSASCCKKEKVDAEPQCGGGSCGGGGGETRLERNNGPYLSCRAISSSDSFFRTVAYHQSNQEDTVRVQIASEIPVQI